MKKKFLGVKFDCCNYYGRLYPNKDNTYYTGRCPKCGVLVRLKIGVGGTSSRFFRVG